jgi:hypothetical protein
MGKQSYEELLGSLYQILTTSEGQVKTRTESL